MTDTSRVTNRNDVAIIDFKVDENGNPSINIDESINSNLTAQQIEETKSIWATFLEIFTPEAISKPREIKILYDSKYNERLQQNLDGGLDAESAHLDAVAGTFGDFVEREGSDYFFGNVYSVDSDMPGAEIAGPIMSYPVDKLKNDVDQSNVVADAFRDFFADNSNNNDSSNSELWVNEDGHLFLLDEDQQMTIKLTGNESVNQTSLLSNSIKEFDTRSVEITNQNGDSQTFVTSKGDKEQLLDNAGFTESDAIYTDTDGNIVSKSDAFFTVEDSEGNKTTILKEGINVRARDGATYEVQSLVNQVENGIRSISKFAFDQTTKFAQGYQQYLADHINDILSDFAMRIARGESMEDAMKDVAEFWGVKALVENSVIDSAVGDLIGNFTENQQLIGGAKAAVEVTVGIGAGIVCGLFTASSLNPYIIARIRGI